MSVDLESVPKIRVAVLSVIKHAYVPRGIFSHARFEPAVVADDADQPDWAHERNERFADEYGVPYVTDVDAALKDFGATVAVVSPAAERHCDLSVRAAKAGLHVVQDKPMSTSLDECDRVVEAVKEHGVRFLMWNRNFLPAVQQANKIVCSGKIGKLLAIHCDFYFAKDAGPPVGSRLDADPKLSWLESLKAAHVTGADGGIGVRAMGELEVEGIYPLAYMHLLTGGARISRVYARTKSHFHQLHADHNVDDLSTMSIEMENGVVGSLCLGRIGNASHPEIGEIKLHLTGSKGSAVIAEPRPEVGIYHRGQSKDDYPNVRVANENDWRLAEDFARAIDGVGQTSLGALESRNICAAVQAAIESGNTGRVVEVNLI